MFESAPPIESDPTAAERFAWMLDGLLGPVAYVGADLTYRWVNGPYERLRGRPRDQIVGRSWADVLGDEAATARESVAAALNGVETTAVGPTDWQTRYVPHQVAGRVVGFVVQWTDVTELRRAEAARAESERELMDALEACEVGTWELDVPTGRCRFGGQWAAMLGYELNELSHSYQTWESLVHPGDLPRLVTALNEHMAGRTPVFVGEKRMRTRSGEWKWVRTRGKVVKRDTDGRPIRIVGTHTDLNDLRQIEEELRASNRFIERVAETNACKLWVLDLATNRVVYTNDSLDASLGYSREEVLAVPDALAQFVHADDLGRVRDFHASWDDVPDGVVRRFEHRGVHRDGSIRYFQNHCVVFEREPDGRASQVVGATLDVTEQKRIAAEQERLQNQLRDVQRLESLGVMAGGIAHDFNNILTGILGFAELSALMVPDDSPIQEHLSSIVAGAQRAAGLCGQMLSFAGKGPTTWGSVDLSAVVRQLGGLVGVAMSRNARLEYDLTDDLPPVVGDGSQLGQVVLNLLTNAFEALPQGVGTVTVSTRVLNKSARQLNEYRFGGTCPPGRYVRLTVRDTGTGMTPETVDRMFDPFFTTKFAGRGLGLAAVLGIIRTHAGAIRVTSAIERGTTIDVLLPVGGSLLTDSKSPVGRVVSGGRLLVVDDEPHVRRLIRMLATGFGIEPVEAADGAEALDLFRARPAAFRGVLLDLTMPGWDGVRVVELLRAVTPTVPVIIMSGYDQADVLPRFSGIPNISFLPKPFGQDDLARLLARLP